MRTASTLGYGQLGRYELLARLAVGGMGEIFLARLSGAEGFEKFYVIKRILPHLADDPRFRTMLIDEARIAAKMSHPNICQVYELGETNGQLFIAMEYLEGVTLLDAVRQAARGKRPMALGLVAGVIGQACDALHYAHELTERDGKSLQVIHRDVTPSNLFLTETGVVKVLDFGIAKVRTASQDTQAGTVKGKYAYMAPEQLQQGEITPRVDVFAAGIVAFEMLALRRLFQRRTDFLTFRALMELPVPNIREFRPDVPAAFAEVLMRALDRNAANRYPTVRAMSTAMQDAVVGHARPWNAGEISDYLRSAFREELAARASAIDNVMHADQTTRSVTMPQLPAIDRISQGESDDGLDDDFPSVESGVHDIVELAEAGVASPATRLDEPATTIRNKPSTTAPPPSSHLVAEAPREAPRRGWIVAAIAVVAVAVAAVAMFALWLQQRSQEPSAPTQIVIEQSNRIDAPSIMADASDSVAAAADASKQPSLAIDARKRVIPTADPNTSSIAQVRRALAAQLGALKACVNEAGIEPGTTMTLGFEVSASGQASNATLRPNNAAVPCIRGIVHGIRYGNLPSAVKLEIPLRAGVR